MGAEGEGTSPIPLVRAHAHNDYEHQRPLFDALERGFCSVEADVHLVDGRLLVAHDRSQVKAERTLESLYLDPLRERIRRFHGRVYPDGPVFLLWIDVKSDAEATYAALREVLKRYSEMLTAFTPNTSEVKAVTIVVSGNRARDTITAEPARLCALDGRIEDLDGKSSSNLIPLISDNWTRLFKWRGSGDFPEEEKRKLHEIVQRAHQQKRKVRFWATPDQPEMWRELLSAGSDLINTDDLTGLQKFLLAQSETGRK